MIEPSEYISDRVFEGKRPISDARLALLKSRLPMTEEELVSLQWFLEHEPTAVLGVDDKWPFKVFPHDRMRTRLCNLGVLEKFDENGLYYFRTTEAGRAALTNGDRA